MLTVNTTTTTIVDNIVRELRQLQRFRSSIVPRVLRAVLQAPIAGFGEIHPAVLCMIFLSEYNAYLTNIGTGLSSDVKAPVPLRG